MKARRDRAVSRPRRSRRQRREGYLYVAVMGVAAVVSIVGLCAMTVARTQLRSAVGARDWQTARQLAQSAVEQAMTLLNTDANWQATYALNVEHPSPALAVNGGTMSWKLVDVGSGQLRLDGIGRKGTARCVLSVTVIRSGANPLAAALIAGGGITLASTADALTVNGGPASTNGTLQNTGTITGNVEAQQLVGNGPATGTQTVPGPIRALPDPNSVFAYYAAKGTDLTAALFGSGTSNAKLSGVLLSPYANPYGTPNPEGIYVIDAGSGKSVTIESCRIVGTLVVLNATKEILVQNEVSWEPAIPCYPALLAQGPLRVLLTDGVLDEAKLARNFNPASTPWQGSSDGTADDSYPSAMAGIIYCAGNIAFDGKNSNLAPRFQGIVMADGTCRLEKTVRLTVKYDDKPFLTPPPGFAPLTGLRLETGSWRQTPSY